jgi:hypothetical protein
MTPTELNRLKELAERVYPYDHWEIKGGAVIHGDILMGRWTQLGDFSPSLAEDATDRQLAQACRVIVAALCASPIVELLSMSVPGAAKFSIRDPSGSINVQSDDLLTACSQALLERGG